MIEDLIKS